MYLALVIENAGIIRLTKSSPIMAIGLYLMIGRMTVLLLFWAFLWQAVQLMQ